MRASEDFPTMKLLAVNEVNFYSDMLGSEIWNIDRSQGADLRNI